MIHSKTITEEKENRFYYVFMDFIRGEEHDMMKHATEFRFYLEAYGKNMTFDINRKSLDRLGFTQLVLKDYLLNSPYNPQEVLTRIRENASSEERNIILSKLINDPEVVPFIL